MTVTIPNSVAMPISREAHKSQSNKVDPVKSTSIKSESFQRAGRKNKKRVRRQALIERSPEVRPASYKAHRGRIGIPPIVSNRSTNVDQSLGGLPNNPGHQPPRKQLNQKRTPPQLAKHPEVDMTPLISRESERTSSLEDQNSLTTSAVCRLPAIVAPSIPLELTSTTANVRDVVETPLLPLHNYIMSDRIIKDQQTFLKRSTDLAVTCPGLIHAIYIYIYIVGQLYVLNITNVNLTIYILEKFIYSVLIICNPAIQV